MVSPPSPAYGFPSPLPQLDGAPDTWVQIPALLGAPGRHWSKGDVARSLPHVLLPLLRLLQPARPTGPRAPIPRRRGVPLQWLPPPRPAWLALGPGTWGAGQALGSPVVVARQHPDGSRVIGEHRDLHHLQLVALAGMGQG